MAAPRITLITPVLNRAGMITEALQSVALQGYPAVEHIVIDGGSTDGTLEILRNTPNIQWMSEPDRGPFDAINKGIRMATGEIIGHLNSDDILLSGALAAVADGFARDRSAEATCGGARAVRLLSDGTTRTVRTRSGERIGRHHDWHGVTLGHPLTNARFFRRSWYRRAGFYDIHYKLSADRDFLIRSMILGMRTVPLERVLYQYRLHPGSLTAETRHEKSLREEYRTIARSWMIRGDSPESLRRMAGRWFAVETAHRLVRLWREKNRHEFAATFMDARETLPGWPFALMREGLHRATGGLW
ncbi:MAG: glycosyltransferase family 2 protein [Rhodospirillaceae bacterium]